MVWEGVREGRRGKGEKEGSKERKGGRLQDWGKPLKQNTKKNK